MMTSFGNSLNRRQRAFFFCPDCGAHRETCVAFLKGSTDRPTRSMDEYWAHLIFTRCISCASVKREKRQQNIALWVVQ